MSLVQCWDVGSHPEGVSRLECCKRIVPAEHISKSEQLSILAPAMSDLSGFTY